MASRHSVFDYSGSITTVVDGVKEKNGAIQQPEKVVLLRG
jgi:hypothetical protein